MTRTCRALLVVCAVCGAIPGERSALGLRLTETALHDTSPVEARLACAGNNNDKEPGVVLLTAYPTWGSGTLRGAAMARALDSTTTNWVVSFPQGEHTRERFRDPRAQRPPWRLHLR